MAARGKNNPYYRTREQLADDVYNVLNSDKLSLGAKHAVIFETTWLWTEIEGKYTGCQYWSKKACAHLHESETIKAKILRHDHVVPRNYIVKRFLYGDMMSSEEVYSFLKTNLVGCILLKSEDDYINKIGYQRKMPSNWNFGDNIWSRYTEAEIDVCEIIWEKKKGSVLENT